MDADWVSPAESLKYQRPQKEWGWQVAVYLYLAGIGAGALAIGLLMDWLGYSPYSSRAILLWGPILVAVGALFLVLKLGIKRRFLNTVMNPRTSWLSRGFYILSLCIVIGVVSLGISILPLLGISIDGWSSIVLTLDVIGFIFAIATAAYTGILIQSVNYVPFWKTSLLPLLFTVSALSTGAMAIILSTYAYDFISYSQGYSSHMTHMIINIEQGLIILEALVLALYLFSRYRAQGGGRNSVRILLSGNLRLVFWLGIVVASFFLPTILESLYSRYPDYSFLLLFAGFSVLAGGFFLRFGIIFAGIKEVHPLGKMIDMQYYEKPLVKTEHKFNL